MVSVQRPVGLGVPRVLLPATTQPDSPSQKAVPAPECRWPPWRTCCRQPSERARELGLTPPGRSGGRGHDNMALLVLVEEEERGLSQSRGPGPILVFGSLLSSWLKAWDISSTNEQLAVREAWPGPGCASLGHLPAVAKGGQHWTALSLVFSGLS